MPSTPPSTATSLPPEYAWFVREPTDSDITDAVKPLSSLYRKGLVRREKAGQTYRYWPEESPNAR